MRIDNIIKYIEHKVKTEKWWTMCGAINDCLTIDGRDEAYIILDALNAYESGDTEQLTDIADLIRDKLIAMYGHSAEQFAIDNAPLSPAEQRFYDAKPKGVSVESWESGVRDRGEF